MNKSFDRVADIYDETRRMPPEAVAGIVKNVRREIDPTDGLMLEMGIGTGRISIPLEECGFRIIGVDIAERMLAQLRGKSAARPIRLLRGDMTALPFVDKSFHAVIAVHVFHLLDDVRAAMREARRVLSSGGSLLFGGEQRLLRYIQETLRENHQFDESFVQAHVDAGIRLPPDQSGVEQEVLAIAESMGGSTTALALVSWRNEVTVFDLLKRIEERTASYLWDISDEALGKLVDTLRTKLLSQVGSPSTPVPFEREFRMFRIRFP